MTDPVLVEVTRGGFVESRHRGAIAIVDAAGTVVTAIGEVARPVFPRSAVKAIQALPLIESGAADAFGFGNPELALACASHSGERRHVETAAAMLRRAGLDTAALECGAHWPSSEAATRELILAGATPSPLHNNCSGKHAGFLATAVHLGQPTAGYVEPDHPVQRRVRDALADLTEIPLSAEICAIDGCSIPTYAIPLDCLAHAFARLATGAGLAPERAGAARRLIAACQAEPFMVAGSGRFCTDAMALFGRRLFVKAGAEGVFCAALPDAGLGVALKCEDGAGRAAQAMMAAVIAALLPMSAAEDAAFGGRIRVPVSTRRGRPVGEVSPVAGLVEALRRGGPFS